MINLKRLALAPALALAAAALTSSPALADTAALSADAVNALAVANCQLDPANPLTLAQMNPVLTGEVDVAVVPGEISAHILRAQVTTSLGDVQQCTFGVLHRDALLPRVKYRGTASLGLVDAATGTSYGVSTEIRLGKLGRGAQVDPTTEVSLGGFLTPVANATSDPAYQISLARFELAAPAVAPAGPTAGQVPGHGAGSHGHHHRAIRAGGRHHGHGPRVLKQKFTVTGSVPVTPVTPVTPAT